jgi:hypothetical protein
MTPLQANDFVNTHMVKTFPLGDVKLPGKEDLKQLSEE